MGTIAHLLRPKGRSKVRVYTFDVDSVPSAETEYAHGLDVTPKAVALTPKTGAGGVDGYIMENKGEQKCNLSYP